MALATFCSRILGLVREQVLAYTFGASGFTDAFLVAYRIPNLLRDLFAEGAFSSAFVPTFVEANTHSLERARKLFWSLFVLLTVTTLCISVGIYIFAPEIINIFAPTFREVPEKYELTITLTRIMSPFLCLVSLAALFMGVLNSLKVFFLPSFAPVFFNIAMIASMLLFPPLLIQKGMHPALSLGFGVLIGGFLQAIVQFPLIIKKGFGPTKPDRIFSTESKKVITLLGPGMIGFAATQINLLVNTILASGTIVGAVSWLSFAFRLFQLPVGILSVSIGNSNLVHFSSAWKRGDKEEAKEYLKSSFFLSCFIVFPAMIALIMCSNEMINVIFERGKFTSYSTFMSAKALKWYALGLPFYSIYKIFVPTFYAIDRQKIPVLCSIFGIAFNIAFCLYFIDDYGFEILALGTTISMFLNSYLQGVILKKDLGLKMDAFINMRLHKVIFSAIASGVAVFYTKTLFSFYDLIFINRCLVLALYLAVIAMSYFGLCIILGERAMVKQVISKFSRRK
jgi:putative peptidoglycan lipid II flippase